jgi:hypothetical protein
LNARLRQKLSLRFWAAALGVSAAVYSCAPPQGAKFLNKNYRATVGALTFVTQPSSPETAGVVFTTQPVINVLNNGGQVVTSANGTVSLSAFSDSTCATAKTTTLTGNTATLTAGVATFSGLSSTKSGSTYFKATSGSFTTGCSALVTIVPANTDHLAFGTQPAPNATAGAAFSAGSAVRVLDPYDNLVTTATDAITLAAFTNSTCTTASTGTFGATTNPVSATSGVSTFAGVYHTKAEQIYVRATAAGLTAACSASVQVVSAAATQLSYATQPSTAGTAGVVLAQQPVVQVFDTYANLVSTSSTSITLAPFTDSACTTTPSSGVFSAATNPLAASAGASTFSGVKHFKTEMMYIRASASGLTSVCSTGVQINPNSPSKLSYLTQPSSSATAGAAFAQQPAVQVLDAYDNLATQSTDNVSIAAYTDSTCGSGATGTLSATANPVLASSGVSTFAGTRYTKAERIYLRAVSGALTAACSTSVLVEAAAATKLGYTVQPSTTGTAGVDFAVVTQLL